MKGEIPSTCMLAPLELLPLLSPAPRSLAFLLLSWPHLVTRWSFSFFQASRLVYHQFGLLQQKYCKLGGVGNTHLFLVVPEAGRHKIRLPPWRPSAWLMDSHLLTGQRAETLLIRAPIPLWGLHPYDLITSQQPPSPHTTTLGIRVTMYKFGEDTNVETIWCVLRVNPYTSFPYSSVSLSE